jgi:hypothetical protein
VLTSRAVDETGAMQPTRSASLDKYRRGYRYNAIQAWAVDAIPTTSVTARDR